MSRLRIAVNTIGCRANQADSARLARHLDTEVIALSADHTHADWIVINTCCITEQAERDCRKAIRRALASSAEVRVLVTGCAISAATDILKDCDDRVVRGPGGDNDPAVVGDWLNRQAGSKNRHAVPADSPLDLAGRTRPMLKIQNGCSHGCAYCIVPQARGKEVSSPRQTILTELNFFKKRGVQELVITGVQLGAWGKDLAGHPALADLLIEMADLFSPGRLRLSSIEPWSVDDALIDAVVHHPRICNHLHMPLQSGDDAILAAMGRGYTTKEFLHRTDEIRKRAPHAAIGVDVIVGFPGESEREFANTMTTLTALQPAYLHAFSYSKRPGTRAATLPDCPSRQLAKQRVRTVRQWGQHSLLAYRRGLIGQRLEVIIEQNKQGESLGLTDTFVPVKVQPPVSLIGGLVVAELTQLLEDSRLLGVLESR